MSAPVTEVRAPAARTGRRATWVVAAGLLLLQLAWVLAVPAFRGSDEFDHVYRAAAAARGQWDIEPTAATRGTGAWLDVPRDIVDAAQAECRMLTYTKDEDCLGTPQGDTVRIASGAGRYHPFLYVVVGTVALPFDGTAALFVMRLTTAMICLALLLLALWVTRLWARTAWPSLAVLTCCTPVVVYGSTVAAAPNGPELMAAVLLWAAGIGLFRAPPTSQRACLVAATLGACLLVTLRPLGPLWCLLAVGLVLLAAAPSREALVALLRRRSTLVAAGLVLVVTLQAVAWTLVKGALRVGVETHQPESLGHKLGWALGQVPLWVFQSIAAFPFRGDESHPVVYFTWLAVFVGLLVLGFRAAGGRTRLALVAVVLLAVALPYAAAVQSYDLHRGAWQGRYGLPLAVGIAVLAGLALDRRGRAPAQTLLVAGALLFVTAQTVSPAYTWFVEGEDRAVVLSARTALIALLALLGSAAMWLGVEAGAPRPAQERPAEEPTGQAPDEVRR